MKKKKPIAHICMVFEIRGHFYNCWYEETEQAYFAANQQHSYCLADAPSPQEAAIAASRVFDEYRKQLKQLKKEAS